ncbi:MAG: AAA family ATPase, partial [Anaerolineales bacterium]
PADFHPVLRIHLLGPPAVYWNKNALTIPRRLVRALLYRLACDYTPVDRGHLQLLFWPEVPDWVARRNLSHLLTHLRRAIPVTDFLKATDNELRLAPEKVWCDTLEFRKILRDPGLDISQLPQLLEIYQGPFLEGFDIPSCPEFEQWCLVERNSLEQDYLGLLETLVRQNTEHGEISQAIKYARQYLKTDSLSETMHQRLIQLYACAGDRHLAIRQFEHCVKILDSALGVKPLPETLAVYQTVVQDRLNFPEASSSLTPKKLPDRQIPIIGRDEEIHWLDQIIQNLKDQQGKVVFISGEAGIGKSCLMHDLAMNHLHGARLLHGCGQAGEQAIPYQPILSVLRTILGVDETGAGYKRSDPAVNREPPDMLDPIWLSEIARLLPEIQHTFRGLQPPIPVDPESARTRLFDAVCYLILADAIENGPVLLCLDDLQWMDLATKAWLIHVGRFITRGDYPIMILGAYRSEEAEAVLEMRHALARAGILVEINLSGLDQDSLLEIQRCLVGERSGEQVMTTQLHRATGGNPFYFIEIIRELIEEGCLEDYFQDSKQIDLPESVREAVQSRLQRLSSIAFQVLEAGAVLGQSFNLELLRVTSGRSHGEIMAALQELETRVLISEDLQGYRFVHDITRQYVEENLGAYRKQLLHRRAGRAYQYSQPSAFSAMAYHFENGGDLQKSLRYHKLAAHQAELLFAWQVVEYHLGRILDQIKQIDPGSDQPELVQQRGEIFAERAGIRNLQDRIDDRDSDLKALSELSETCDNDSLRLQLIFNRLRYQILDGEYPQAIATAENGLDLLDSNPNLPMETEQIQIARSRLLAQTGFAYYFMGKPAEALGLLEEAWNICEALADPEALGRVLHILGYIYSNLADFHRALECQQQAYAYHAKAENYDLMAWDLIDIGATYKKLGDLVQAERFIQDGLELSTRMDSQRAMAYALTKLGMLDLIRGEYAVALVHFQRVLEMQQAVHYGYIIAAAEAGMGFTLYLLGDYAYSRHWLERALQRSQASGLRKWEAEILIKLGVLNIGEGQLTLARQHLERGLILARDCQSGECQAAGLAAQARLERLSGNL